MGLIECPDCGKKISELANNCPNCGRPMSQGVQPIKQTVSEDAKQATQQGTSSSSRQKKRGHGCLITLLVFFLFTFFLMVLMRENSGGKENSSENADSLSEKFMEITAEQGNDIDNVLRGCGIEKIETLEHDELLDNAHFEGETGYRIAINDTVKNIIMYLDTDMKVYSLRYADYDLYINGETVATLQDYTFTSSEISDLQIRCQEIVKEILKSPSTAKFPSILQWGFAREKNIVTVQGYVDSQNGFGAEIRSDFQLIIDTDMDVIQSFIFDGEELMQ